MYPLGHYGMALLVYAPVGAVALSTGHDGIAFACCAGTVALSRLPDVDRDLVFVSHRGVTHTLAFALFVGSALAAGATALFGSTHTTPLPPAVIGFGVGLLAIGSHLLADLLTPMGVPLLWPLSSKRYTFGLARSDDLPANYLLLALGLAVSFSVVFGVTAVR